VNLTNSEIQLIRAFKKGDAEAFKLLFERYHKRLYSFLFRLLKTKEDAEEIVQETFLKIWENRENYWEEYPFESLLFRIVDIPIKLIPFRRSKLTP